MANNKYQIDNEIAEDLELEEPKQYQVLLLNDDFSTMDFVIEVLIKIFKKSLDEAETLMLKIHTNGEAICGIYTYEIALTKIMQVKNMAREEQFPLKAIIQEI